MHLRGFAGRENGGAALEQTRAQATCVRGHGQLDQPWPLPRIGEGRTRPLRVACFTDHAAERFCRTGKKQEDQDWEPPEVEEEREEEDLLELPPKKHTKTKTTKVCMLQPST